VVEVVVEVAVVEVAVAVVEAGVPVDHKWVVAVAEVVEVGVAAARVVVAQVGHKLLLEVVVAVAAEVEQARVDHKLVLDMEVAAMALVVAEAAEEGARTNVQELSEAVLACGFLQPGPVIRPVHPTQVVTARQTLVLGEAREQRP
jgi:hypothetical protein